MRKQDDWTLVHVVRSRAVELGERPFLRFEQGAELTFRGLDKRSDRFALALAAGGILPGERVMALVKNRAEFLVAMIGTMKAGAIFVPINTELKGAFLEHQLCNAEPAVVIVDAALIEVFASVEKAVSRPRLVIICAGGIPSVLPCALSGSPVSTFDDFENTGADHHAGLADPRPHEIGAIMYTSGTTGPAKGVLMTHAHMYLMSFNGARGVGLRRDDVFYVCMPMFHANALFLQVTASLYVGASGYVVERFSPNRWLDEVIVCGATITNALGVMPEFIFNTPPTPRDRAHKLRAIMVVPISKEWGEDFRQRFGVRLIQGFGMTECNIPAYSSLEEEELIPGCAGYIVDDLFEVMIADPETDDPMPQGEVGEIVIRPKVPAGFSAGYFKMPERTVEAWRSLWFHTGDAGRFDEKGRLHYIDRIKDCIRRRGENISAFEVEQVLNRHPLVMESAVVGVRVAGAGGEEEVKAIIVARQGVDIDPVALLDFCADRMPRYAVPRFIEFVKSLDKTASGKLRKQDLRDAGITVQTWDRDSVGYKIPRH